MSDLRRMSASQGTFFNECPLAWKFKYLDKIKPEKLVTYDSTLFGSAFHSTLEELIPLNEIIEEKLEITPLLFLREFKKHFNKSKEDGYHVVVSGGNLEKTIKNFIYSAKLGVGKILNDDLIKSYNKLICEGEFKYENEYFNLEAKIDLVGMHEDGSYDIIDFKTGKHFNFKGITKELQALFYIMVCYDKFKRLPKSFKFLKYDKINFSLKTIDIDEEITLETIEHFNNAVKLLHDEITQSIETDKFRKRDATQKSQYCSWCNYRSACKKVK